MPTTRMVIGFAVGSMTLLGASIAQAQACVGLPNVATMRRSISTTGAGTDLGRTMVARYGMAGQRVFGGAEAGYAGDKFANPQSPVFGADVGFIVPLGTDAKVQLCPTLQSVYQDGPNGSDYSHSRLSSSVGLSVGRAFGETSAVGVVPFVQGRLQHLRQTYAYTSVGTGPNGEPGLGQWGHTSKVFGEVGLGVGLRVNRRLTISPAYRMPVGLGSRRYNAILGEAPSYPGVPQQTYSLSVTLGFPR